MQQIEKLIINAEFFLQCHGSCSGCFLSINERSSNLIYTNNLHNSFKKIASDYKNIFIEELIIGFGRGNILNLNKEELGDLLFLIEWIENNFFYGKVIFEVSTSLIGKIDFQINNADYLLGHNRNIYFNMVINSEITSPTFWKNLSHFYECTSNIRKGWGMKEDWGDILVLNVNPDKLPNLNFIKQFIDSYHSPVNISIFPFDSSKSKINTEDIKKVMKWSENLWLEFHEKDLNIKNYLSSLAKNDINYSLLDLEHYYDITKKSYYFIDKNGHITNGSLSIMGEVDKVRLLNKYNLTLDIKHAYKSMQKNIYCNQCEYQKECLLSGAYLNFLANKEKFNYVENRSEENLCLSGYQKLFELSNRR